MKLSFWFISNEQQKTKNEQRITHISAVGIYKSFSKPCKSSASFPLIPNLRINTFCQFLVFCSVFSISDLSRIPRWSFPRCWNFGWLFDRLLKPSTMFLIFKSSSLPEIPKRWLNKHNDVNYFGWQTVIFPLCSTRLNLIGKSPDANDTSWQYRSTVDFWCDNFLARSKKNLLKKKSNRKINRKHELLISLRCNWRPKFKWSMVSTDQAFY